MLTLRGKTCELREFTEANLSDPRYYEWLRDLDVVTGIYRLEYLKPLDRGAIEQYAREQMKSDTKCYFAIYLSDSETFVGTIKLGHIDWRTGTGDVGIMIGDKANWGKGIATDAVHTLCSYAFKKLSLRKITGGTAANNAAMVQCFHRVGFKQEGALRKKLLVEGAYHDHLLFGLFQEELREPA